MTQKTQITRRSFMKMTALAGAAAAIGTSMSGSLIETDEAYAQSPSETKVVLTSCHGCTHVCPARAYVKDGVVVKLEGDPRAPISKGSMCVKGLNQLHTMYSPRRILHPLKRAGERGENKWEVISWDEAVDLAATQITSIIDKFGPFSFFTSAGGGGHYSFDQSETLPMALGATTAFEPGAAQCYLPRRNLSQLMYCGTDQSIVTGNFRELWKDVDNAIDTVVLWATQPSIAQTAEAGRGLADLRAGGIKTIVVDPNFTPDAAKADVWLPVRPGTDCGVALSWWRYIIENKLYDETFTKYWTNLPHFIDPDTKLPVEAKELFPDYVSPTPDNTPAFVCFDLRTNSVQPFPFSAPEDSPVDPEIFTTQTINGKTYKTAGQIYKEEAEPWTLEHAEEVCWTPADRNEAAIRMYAEAKVAGIGNGVASDQTESASQLPLGLMGLDAFMGYVNKPGCCLSQQGPLGADPTSRPIYYVDDFGGKLTKLYGMGAVIGKSPEENAQIMASATASKEEQEIYKNILLNRLGSKNHKGLYGWHHSHIPTVRNAIATGEPYKPRVWFDFSGNKLAMLGDAQSWYDVLPEIDFIIGQYPMLTSFHIEAADLVFPLREWLEEPMVHMNQINTTWFQSEVTHIGETVTHYIPSALVFEKCLEKWGGKTPGLVGAWEGVGRITSEATVKENIAKKLKADSWEDLNANVDKYVPQIMPPEKYWNYGQHEVIVDDGLPAGFATESRKFEVYAQIVIKMSRTGYPHTYPYEHEACEDYSPICRFTEPAESPVNDKDDEYPLILTSGRVPYFHHGTMRHAAFSRELYPAPELRIHPVDADKYGIEHMDWVKVTSRRGETSARAHVTKGIVQGVVLMERFWFPECYDETQKTKTAGWRECNVNILTKASAPYNEIYGSYSNRGFTVKVEKGQKPANIWIEPEEFEPFMPTLQSEAITKDVV